jgi:hypothetical protein
LRQVSQRYLMKRQKRMMRISDLMEITGLALLALLLMPTLKSFAR